MTSIKPIPNQLNFEKILEWLPKAQVKQPKYKWQNKENNSTKKELAKAMKQLKTKVWKWVPKKQHQETSIPKYKWIPKHPTTSTTQSQKFFKKPQ